MKKLLFAFLIAAFLLTDVSFAQGRSSTAPAATAKPAADKPVFAVPFVNRKLANGLEVIVLPDTSVPLVTVELAVRNGSFTEPPELNGLSHLYEHMFFKPNMAALLMQCQQFILGGGVNPICDEPMRLREKIGETGYLRDIERVGMTYNGTTREEVVNYYFTTTSPNIETAIRVINHGARFPLFHEQDLEEEKRVVLGELERNDANPFSHLFRAVNDKLFYKYPTRKNPGGTRETVAAATVKDMRTIQSRYYFPNNAALIITGDVIPEDAFKLAEKLLGDWEPRKEDPFKEFPLVEHPPLEKSAAEIIEKNTGTEEASDEQNVFINIGWHGPSIGDDDEGTYAADVFSYILTQPDHRFQRNLVDSGLASSASINYYTQRNVGPITVFLITTPDKAKAALKAAYAEIALFADPKYYTDEELENSKTILEANDLFDREKPSEYAHTLGFWWSSTGIDYFRDYHKNLRAVSREDIDKYVKRYIVGKNRVAIAMLAPGVKAKAGLTEADLLGTAK